jgi:hypothetical protein
MGKSPIDLLTEEINNLHKRIQAMEEESWTECTKMMPPLYKISLPYLFRVSSKYSYHYELAYADDEDFFNKYNIKNLAWKPVEVTQIPADYKEQING